MFKTLKNDNEAVSPVIGVILMVAITVVLATVVFVLVSDMGGNVNTDNVRLTMQEHPSQMAAYRVLTVEGEEVTWGNVEVQGCDTVPLDADVISPGDVISDCEDEVLISYDGTTIWTN